MLTVTSAQIDQWLAVLWWPFLRIMGMMLVDPFFSSGRIPTRIRMSLALAITILVSSSLQWQAEISVSPASFPGVFLAAKELLIGATIGFVARLFFSTMELAGHLIGLQMGLGFASFYDPQNSTSVPIMSQFMSLFALLIFLAFNGHLMMLRVVMESFTLLPIGTGPKNVEGFWLLAKYAEVIFRMGVLLSLPVLGSLLLTNLAIGIMSRAAPQLNVFAVGFPITLGVGYAALYLTIPFMVPHVDHMLGEMTRFLEQMLQTFAR